MSVSAHVQDLPLLKPKFHIPPVRTGQVLRPRLIERLNAGTRPGHKLILISAPAGFGKTTLLSEWIAGLGRADCGRSDHEVRVAWDAMRAGDAASEKMAKEFWSSQRNIAFAVNRDDPEAGVQMFPFGTTIKKRLRHFVLKLGKNYTDFKEGFDIVIERTGQGLDTEYQSDLGEQCAITDSKKQLEQWVSELPDLHSFAKVLSYDEIMQKFSAVSGQPSPARKAVASATIDADLSETSADDDDGDAF